jgi:hypothetical protein
LSVQLDRWVRDRLLTDEQARRILAHEQRPAPESVPAPAPTPTPAPAPASVPSARTAGRLVAEALAYLGGVIALAAGLLLVQLAWSDLSAGVRLAVPLAAAVILLLSGVLVPGDVAERRRLRSALWALGAGAWMAALAVLGDQVLDAARQDTLLLTGLGGFALALRLYLTSRQALQQLVLLATTALTAAALADRAGWDEPTLVGLGIWLVAAAWFVLGERNALTPPDAARYSAAAGMVVGALLTQGSLGGQLLAAGTAAFLLVRGALTDRIGLVVVAAVAALNMIPSAVQFFFPDGGRLVVPLALLATGTALVGTAVAVTRRRSS